MRSALLALLLSTVSASAQDKVAPLGVTMLDTSFQTSDLVQIPAKPPHFAMFKRPIRDRFSAQAEVLSHLELERVAINPVRTLAKLHRRDTQSAARLYTDGELPKTPDADLTTNHRLREVSNGQLVRSLNHN